MHHLKEFSIVIKYCKDMLFQVYLVKVRSHDQLYVSVAYFI